MQVVLREHLWEIQSNLVKLQSGLFLIEIGGLKIEAAILQGPLVAGIHVKHLELGLKPNFLKKKKMEHFNLQLYRVVGK